MMAIRKKPFCLRMKGFFASVQEARKILAKKEETKIPLLLIRPLNKLY